ncbi:MAG: helix-turn-helix transcriptional regulator, partial [Bacteroidota bacterium]
ALAPHATPQSDVSPETTRRVRDHLEDALPRGEVTVGATARALGVSVRTLQRQLATEGTTYAEVVERTRRSAASRLLDAGISVQEVASRLGYAEPTSFTRAYRRWHGHPPSKR